MFFVKKSIGTVPELLQLEEWFGTDDQELLNERYDKALEALATGDIEEWLADAARSGITSESADRFREDWIGGRRVPMLASRDGKSRMQQGFIAAITEARTNGKKLSILFALAGTDEFAVDHVPGNNAVTVVIMVPTAAKAAYQVEQSE